VYGSFRIAASVSIGLPPWASARFQNATGPPGTSAPNVYLIGCVPMMRRSSA
jgi:hypothetical protein